MNGFLLLKVGASPPSVGLHERREMCRVDFCLRWLVDHISHKYTYQIPGNFEKTTANFAYSAPFLQRLRIWHQQYSCQTLSSAQSMAVAVGSVFHRNLAGCDLSVRSRDELSSPFGAKSEISIHTADSTVRFAVQPTNIHHRR